MMVKEDLMERISKEIKNREFNVFEMTGFRFDPNLALIVGAAIGYQLGLDDFK